MLGFPSQIYRSKRWEGEGGAGRVSRYGMEKGASSKHHRGHCG